MDDWDRSEADDLRAEIRCLPIVLRYAREPKVIGKLLGKPLTESLRLLSQGANLSSTTLVKLHAELKAIGE